MKIASIPYTLCFCLTGESVLMLYRNSPPNQSLWNGIGGKIESDESILKSLYREVLEESEIELSEAKVRYTGVVSWNVSDHVFKGMYCFLAYLPPYHPISDDKVTREGILSWKKLDWVLDSKNEEIVSNIPLFLPQMLSESKARLYTCSYKNHVLEKMDTDLLPREYFLSD